MSTPLPIAGQHRLTHSRMATAKTCLRQHYFKYELGVRPAGDSRPLRMGSAVHLGLDLRAQGASRDDAILQAVADYETPPAWANDEEKLHAWAIEREKVARLLSGYFWYWEEGDAWQGLEVVASEQSFEIPLRNPETGRATTSFTLAGKIDKIVRLPGSGGSGGGRLAVMEHKTCSEDLAPDSDYWKRLRLDQQISLYMHAARQLGHDVQTVLYDVVRKPTISPAQVPLRDEEGLKIVLDEQGERVFKKDGKPRQSGDAKQGYVLQSRVETPAEYGERLTDDIAARPEYYFARREIPRLDRDLAEFQAELWQIQQQLRSCQRSGWWFRNTGACRWPFRCEYLDICHDGLDLAGDELPEGFVRVDNVNPELEEEGESP